MAVVLSVFISCSLDGYIADDDGRLDWLDAAAVAEEDYGFDAFLATVDALAMGRGTYDHIAHLDPLPFGSRPVFVFTHRPPAPRPGVTFCSMDPAEARLRWEQAGLGRVYLDGGHLISAFLDENLVDVAATGTIAATNLFARTASGWKLVLHHGSPVMFRG